MLPPTKSAGTWSGALFESAVIDQAAILRLLRPATRPSIASPPPKSGRDAGSVVEFICKLPEKSAPRVIVVFTFSSVELESTVDVSPPNRVAAVSDATRAKLFIDGKTGTT
jgi:hypothetical protein